MDSEMSNQVEKILIREGSPADFLLKKWIECFDFIESKGLLEEFAKWLEVKR